LELRPDPDAEQMALSDLAEILAIPAFGIELGELYGLVVDRLQRVLSADRAAVFEFDERLRCLVVRTSRGLPYDEMSGWSVAPGEGLIGRAFEERRTLTALGATTDDLFLDRFPSMFSLATPLVADGEVAGILYLGRRSGKTLNGDEFRLLHLLADRCSTALVAQRLVARMTRQAERLRELTMVPAVARVREPLEATLARTCEAGCRVLGVAAGLVVAGEGEAAVRASHGCDASALGDWPIDEAAVRALGHRAVLSVPLRFGDRTLGHAYFLDWSERRFTQEEVRAGELVGALMAAAVENARAFEETRAALQQLSAAQEQLIQAEKARALADVAGGIAHEFNNLLAIILGKTQLALERTDSNGVREDLTVVEETAWRAADTVRRLLAFVATRGDEGMCPVDLNALVQDVVTFTRALWKDDAEAHGIKIEAVMDLAEAVMVHGIATELREALTNIILNAIDAMPRGGRIAIRTRRRDRMVELSVSDTGEGMPPDVQSRIFDPFFTTRSPQRAGLGLSVVHGIVGRHHGRIDVHSEEGQGTTVTLLLQESRLPSESWGMPSAPATRRVTGSVLVIEDEEHLRRMLLDTLASVGHTVEGAANGLEGLARFQRGTFDVVVTDLSMPECSGLDVTRAVKKMSPGTPVVMITGWGDVMNPDRMGDTGVDLMLVKPFKMERVLSVLDDALALRTTH
jgi:signal transduction histidine kinase/ActR/RegA family two-component response regulator